MVACGFMMVDRTGLNVMGPPLLTVLLHDMPCLQEVSHEGEQLICLGGGLHGVVLLCDADLTFWLLEGTNIPLFQDVSKSQGACKLRLKYCSDQQQSQAGHIAT